MADEISSPSWYICSGGSRILWEWFVFQGNWWIKRVNILLFYEITWKVLKCALCRNSCKHYFYINIPCIAYSSLYIHTIKFICTSPHMVTIIWVTSLQFRVQWGDDYHAFNVRIHGGIEYLLYSFRIQGGVPFLQCHNTRQSSVDFL